jgi:pyruvate formate lyase activating enzyme
MLIFSKGWSQNNDGPGQRLVFYLKGCNMRCRWCASPESFNNYREILFFRERAKGNIDYVCPHGALVENKLNREKCLKCATFECVKKWKSSCLELLGQEISPIEILTEAKGAMDFFTNGGGVTFGGGEATLQKQEVLEALRLLKKHKIHTAIETNASTEAFKEIAETIDLLICDFKAFDGNIHQQMTGIKNDLILENLSFAIKNKDNLLLRIPMIPGMNDTEKEMRSMADFLQDAVLDRLGELHVEILRMHHMGMPKYNALDLKYLMQNISEPSLEAAAIFQKRLKSDKIKVTIGG